jgi:hypothetical protein
MKIFHFLLKKKKIQEKYDHYSWIKGFGESCEEPFGDENEAGILVLSELVAPKIDPGEVYVGGAGRGSC